MTVELSPAAAFAWQHHQLGHAYFVTRSAVCCSCGESFVGPTWPLRSRSHVAGWRAAHHMSDGYDEWHTTDPTGTAP